MYRRAAAAKFAVTAALIFGIQVMTFGQPGSVYRLPEGTRLTLKLDAELNSGVSSVNDTFVATVAKPIIVQKQTLVPVGTRVEGRVVKVSPAARGGKGGTLDVAFETIWFSETSRHMSGVLVDPLKPHSSRTYNLLSVFGGAAAGALLGSLAGSGKGALIGGGLGAGTGAGVALFTKGEEVRIPKDREFEIELKKEVILPVIDY